MYMCTFIIEVVKITRPYFYQWVCNPHWNFVYTQYLFEGLKLFMVLWNLEFLPIPIIFRREQYTLAIIKTKCIFTICSEMNW